MAYFRTHLILNLFTSTFGSSPYSLLPSNYLCLVLESDLFSHPCYPSVFTVPCTHHCTIVYTHCVIQGRERISIGLYTSVHARHSPFTYTPTCLALGPWRYGEVDSPPADSYAYFFTTFAPLHSSLFFI